MRRWEWWVAALLAAVVVPASPQGALHFLFFVLVGLSWHCASQTVRCVSYFLVLGWLCASQPARCFAFFKSFFGMSWLCASQPARCVAFSYFFQVNMAAVVDIVAASPKGYICYIFMGFSCYGWHNASQPEKCIAFSFYVIVFVIFNWVASWSK